MMSSAIGRVSDDFWSPDGIRHSGNVLGYHLTGDEQNIGQLQVVQKSLTDFLIRITNKPEPTPEVFEFIRNKMHKIIGDNINIKIDVVEHLEKEKSGKLRLVKCEINPPEEFRLKRTGRAGN
jgi:hypothetical protein